MGRHDIDLVEPEAKPEMEQHVEGHAGKNHEHEPGLTPEAGNDSEQQEEHEERLDHVVERVAIAHNDGAVAQHVAQQMVFVQLDSLAEEVLDQGIGARGGDVGPPHEAVLGNGLAVGVAAGCGAGTTHRVETAAELSQLGRVACLGCILQLQRQGALGLSFLASGCFLLALSVGSNLGVLGFLHGQHELLVLDARGGPEQGRGQQHGEKQIAPVEEAAPIGEQPAEEHLHAVAEADAASDDKDDDSLPDGELAMLPHEGAAKVDDEEQHHEREQKVVGGNGCNHDMGQAEEQGGKHDGHRPTDADELVLDAVGENEGIETEHNPHGCHDIEHAVDAGEGGQTCVQPAQRCHEKGQQRMTEHVVQRRP